MLKRDLKFNLLAERNFLFSQPQKILLALRYIIVCCIIIMIAFTIVAVIKKKKKR